MDGAFGGDGNSGEPARQALADFASAPAGMLTLHIQEVVLDLKGKLVSVTIGTSAAVREPVNAALLVAIEDLVAGFARNPALRLPPQPAPARHPPRPRATNCRLSSITEHAFHGIALPPLSSW